MPKNKGNRKFQIIRSSAKSPKAAYPIAPQSPGYYDLYPYFSFRYYHKDHKKFTFAKFDLKDFKKFIERIYAMSQNRWRDIGTRLRKFYHFHDVNWSDTSVKQGFSHLPGSLKDYPVIQFELFEECRVFGFFNSDNVFKIVWVDREHDIYSERKK